MVVPKPVPAWASIVIVPEPAARAPVAEAVKPTEYVTFPWPTDPDDVAKLAETGGFGALKPSGLLATATGSELVDTEIESPEPADGLDTPATETTRVSPAPIVKPDGIAMTTSSPDASQPRPEMQLTECVFVESVMV